MKVIDYWCNAFTPDRQIIWETAIAASGLKLKVRSGDDGFADPNDMVERMNTLDITTLVIPTCDLPRDPDPTDFALFAARPDELERWATHHPSRFAAAWSVDPRAGMAGVRRAAAVLTAPWSVALHVHTHSFDRRFDHADYYPYYALAGEHGVPVIMQAGTSGGLMPSECGHPIGVDRPAIYFPDTTFVLSHTGWPWVDEAVAMALKFPNVYIGTAVYPQRHWPPVLKEFLRGPGHDKVMFGTGFPVAGHRHTLGQLNELDLPAETLECYLSGTARTVLRRLGIVDVTGNDCKEAKPPSTGAQTTS